MKKLNLGCGTIKLPGYINIDANVNDSPDLIIDDLSLLPYDTNSIDEVRTDALLEHLYPWEQIPCLKEWYRILKPGGILYINWLPDFEAVAEAYVNKKLSIVFSGKAFTLYDVFRYSHGDYSNPGFKDYRGLLQLHKDIFDEKHIRSILSLSGAWKNVTIEKVRYKEEPVVLSMNIKAEK